MITLSIIVWSIYTIARLSYKPPFIWDKKPIAWWVILYDLIHILAILLLICYLIIRYLP